MADVLPPIVGSPESEARTPTWMDPDAVLLDAARRIRPVSRADLVELGIAVGAGVAGAYALCALLDWHNPVTFAIWAVLASLAIGWATTRDRLGSVAATDRLVTSVVWLSGLIAVGALAWLIVFLLIKGLPWLSASFFTEDMSKAGPLDANGGALHSIIGTLEQTSIATAIAVPLGILTAVYLHEMQGRLSPIVRFVSDAMSGLPSIVAGLLWYTVWVSTGNPIHGFSGIAGSGALVVIMLPIITRTSEEILRTVDPGLRESALALGSPEWRTTLRIVLPTARAGLLTASILGIARVIGETAPLLLTAFGSSTVNVDPLHDPQSALPLFVYSLIKQPNLAQNRRAFAAAVVLVGIVLVLFVAARTVSARGTRRLKGKR